jgi:hypothetical protein
MLYRLTMRLPAERELTGLDPSLPAAALALVRSGLVSAGCLESES